MKMKTQLTRTIGIQQSQYSEKFKAMSTYILKNPEISNKKSNNASQALRKTRKKIKPRNSRQKEIKGLGWILMKWKLKTNTKNQCSKKLVL
jgi:hypothetical protein